MKKTYVVTCTAAGLGLALLTGCGNNKASEPFHDAARSGNVKGSAVVGPMPDGFGNWARKCDGTTAVYTLFHSDSAYGGIAVVPNSANCPGATQ